MNNINKFKEAQKRFTEALRYIMANEQKLRAIPEKWTKVQKNFKSKFEEPMDAAWQVLNDEEKKRLGPIYLHKKVQSDPLVKKVLEIFDGKIVSVKEK